MDVASTASGRGALDRSVSEHSWQLTVLETAARLGWWRHYTPDWHWLAVKQYAAAHPSKRKFLDWSDRGWPDLELWHEGFRRHIYVELKSEGGSLSEHQVETLRSLHAAGDECYAWKPRDWDQVERVLRGGPREDDGTGFLKPWPRLRRRTSET